MQRWAFQRLKKVYEDTVFYPATPRDCIFFMATDKENNASQAFWGEELKAKCVMFKTHLMIARQVTDDGTQLSNVQLRTAPEVFGAQPTKARIEPPGVGTAQPPATPKFSKA